MEEQEGAQEPQQHVPPPPQVEQAPAMVLTSTIRTRLKWHPISMRLEGSAGGSSKVIHPFLIHHRDNWMDDMLVRTLMVEQPFAASFGKAGLAWKEFAFGLSLTEDPDGHLIYGQIGISDKAAKKRCEELMAYVKKRQSEVPFQTGCDDQAPATALEHALDDLYEIYTEKLSSTKIASTSVAAQKTADKANAQTIRDSSLGLLTPQDKTKLKEGTSNSSGGSAAGTASSARKRNSSMVVDMMENASERLTYRRESHVAKEARRREKQVSKALEREREFNFKVEEAKKASELQKMQLEINVEMLRFLRSQKEKEGKDNSKEE
ncbi:hypothetical protein MHU86_7898 [Fragilaria crotonensis]|nr:hypothetical protein MHU86_7898 [Fragilaria crotonensis]